MGRVIQRLEQEIADLEEEDRKLLLHAAQRRLFLNRAEDNRGRQWLISTAPEHNAEPASAKPTVHQGASSASRRQHRPVDARKELIASLKARHRGAPSREICELIDRTINRMPSRKAALAPLDSWQKRAPGARSWVDFYEHPETHNSVRSYVNKVPPLETAKSPK
jgi:hypothetical protein